jgi:UDP-N-acetylglucosamine transferase subunit ALG13
MIFVTIGSSHFGFARLIIEVDRLAGLGILSDVIAQIGQTAYEPRHCLWQRFLTPAEIQMNMRKANFVICHAGCGTIEEGVRLHKKMIVVPRLGRLKEAPDDHQWEIARPLVTYNRVLLAREIQELAVRVREITDWTPSFAPPRVGNPVVTYITEFITHEIASRK